MKLLLLGLIMVVALLVSGISDTSTSIADTSILNNEAVSSVSEAGNPDSASATINDNLDN